MDGGPGDLRTIDVGGKGKHAPLGPGGASLGCLGVRGGHEGFKHWPSLRHV